MNLSFFSLGFHLGSDVDLRCSTYPDHGPILSIEVDGGWINLSARNPADLTDRDLANAQALAEHVQIYLAECERVHAVHAIRQTAA